MPVVLWQKNRIEFYAWLGTLVICLIVGVEMGLLFGIVINAFYLLYLWARPVTAVTNEESENIKYIRICPNIGLFYPAIDTLRQTINKAALKYEYSRPVVLDCSKIIGLDYTSAEVLYIIMTSKWSYLFTIKKHFRD